MKNSFIILLFVLFHHNISYSQKKSNVECGFFGTKTVEERKSIFPFSEAEKILLISYPNAEVYELSKRDSTTLTYYGYKIKKEFIFHDSLKVKLYDATKVSELMSNDKSELSNFMFNYDYKFIDENKPIKISYSDCYTPRNAIIFLNKNEKVISILEICFECNQYYMFPNSSEFKDVLGLECDKRLGYFRKMFDDYGFENSKNNTNLTFQIFDNQGALRGASLIANNSKIVHTDYDGLTSISLNKKTEKVQLSYMGKPTFIKIIKNCDFIKVDLSKGKAFYYKDNKFIKSKKLIIK